MASGRSGRQARRPQRPWRRLRGWGTLIGGIVLAAVVVGGLVAAERLTRGSSEIPERTATAEGRTLGRADAPVTIVEYSDFQCPFCARAAREIVPQIEQSFIDGGLAKLEFRHFAFIGGESVMAAEAAECAGEQGMFWEYHDKLFSSQSGENQGAFSNPNLKRFAGELGLDQASFDACLESRRFASAVQDETEAGRRAGVESTPTFFVNGTKIEGARPFDEFERAITEALGSQ